MDQEFSELTPAETAWLDDLLVGLRRDGVDPHLLTTYVQPGSCIDRVARAAHPPDHNCPQSEPPLHDCHHGYS